MTEEEKTAKLIDNLVKDTIKFAKDVSIEYWQRGFLCGFTTAVTIAVISEIIFTILL